jgi:PAS domain S-box-containing protein
MTEGWQYARCGTAAVSDTTSSVSVNSRRFAVIGDLWNSADTAIAVFEGDRRYADVNDAFCELTGYARGEMLTKSAGDLSVPGDVSVPLTFEKVTRHWSATVNVRLRRKDGTIVDVSVRAYRCSMNDKHLVVALFSPPA